MRTKFAALVAVAAAITAVPAVANEARVELRGGEFFADGSSDESIGLAIGYDFDLSETIFVGVEASGDKILSGGTEPSFGFSTRLGTSFGESLRAFVAGGYHTPPCDGCVSAYSVGAGGEYALSEGVYLKAEYRHFLPNHISGDYDAVLVGVGIAMP